MFVRCCVGMPAKRAPPSFDTGQGGKQELLRTNAVCDVLLLRSLFEAAPTDPSLSTRAMS